jgi:hypothetical protein
MSKPKFLKGDRVLVEDIYKGLVEATVKDIERHDGCWDYLCKPVNQTDDLCGCRAKDCGGVNWFLEQHVKLKGGSHE